MSTSEFRISHTISKTQVKPGDDIFFWTSFILPHQHHGICIGNNCVIHTTMQSGKLCVVQQTLEEFAGTNTLKLTTYGESTVGFIVKTSGKCRVEKSDDAKKVVQRAMKQLQAQQTYKYKDSDSFAFYCKTGIRIEGGTTPVVVAAKNDNTTTINVTINTSPSVAEDKNIISSTLGQMEKVNKTISIVSASAANFAAFAGYLKKLGFAVGAAASTTTVATTTTTTTTAAPALFGAGVTGTLVIGGVGAALLAGAVVVTGAVVAGGFVIYKVKRAHTLRKHEAERKQEADTVDEASPEQVNAVLCQALEEHKVKLEDAHGKSIVIVVDEADENIQE